MGCIQCGLQALTKAFCRPQATKRGNGQVQSCNGPCPRVELPYMYLMAWFTLHCPAIIQPGEEPLEGICFTHLALRVLSGSESIWQGFRRLYIATMLTASFGTSLIFQVLGTAKSYMILVIGNPHWGKVYSSGWLALDCPTWYTL